MGVTVALWFGR